MLGFTDAKFDQEAIAIWQHARVTGTPHIKLHHSTCAAPRVQIRGGHTYKHSSIFGCVQPRTGIQKQYVRTSNTQHARCMSISLSHSIISISISVSVYLYLYLDVYLYPYLSLYLYLYLYRYVYLFFYLYLNLSLFLFL